MSSRPVTSLSYAARREFVERVLPFYREASLAQKALLLDKVVVITGYARKYAIELLNHAPQGKRTIDRQRQPRYSSQVRQALVAAWRAARYICAKRLIPFLPTLVAALERHEHLHLTQENRSQLLSMSITTAERVLRSHHKPAPRGRSTTKAGPLLKEQIPIRTFQQWDDTRPGFLEADLVAHCGGPGEGCFLYTLTLTDVATGWTECLPVLYKSPEAVLAAFQQARQLFPFPILGLDADNGGEFINETLLSYCEAQQITFTRGREGLKNDQCFVEQKNGAIVRQFVGFDRLAGQQTSRQLRELYRALRLYVNCFQPSLKLLSKHLEGEKVRRVYDAAKTPLQRLLLSGSLPDTTQHHLCEIFQALDPLSLLHHLEDLQQALWYGARSISPLSQSTTSASIMPFCVERCLQGALPPKERISAPAPVFQGQQQIDMGLLDWTRTTRDPFEGEWERILSLVLAHPEWSGGDLFQQLQCLCPGRFHASHLRTFQCGLRKIRARLLEIMEEPWPEEVIQASVLTPIEPQTGQQKPELPTNPLCRPAASALEVQAEASEKQDQPVMEEEERSPQGCVNPVLNEHTQPFNDEGDQSSQTIEVGHLTMTIEGAIQTYIREQVSRGRSRKTLEWHQTALGLLQQYLVSERHLCFLRQITEREVRGWLASLRTTPSATGTLRGASTIFTYARSARAFCHWVVRNRHLERTPFAKGIFPKGEKKRICLIEPSMFDRLLLACRPAGDTGAAVERAAARNRAILWVLLDTGMRASELCGLRLSDVDCEQRTLRVEARRKERWVTLSPNGWYPLLTYLEQHRPKKGCSHGESVQEEPLFLSETYDPLTVNTLTLLFDRLKRRAGVTQQRVSSSALRDTFAVRYLQAGGELDALGSVLGLRDRAALKRYKRVSDQMIEKEQQKEPAEEQVSTPIPAPQQSKRRRKGHRRRQPGAISSQEQAGLITVWARSRPPMQMRTHEWAWLWRTFTGGVRARQRRILFRLDLSDTLKS